MLFGLLSITVAAVHANVRDTTPKEIQLSSVSASPFMFSVDVEVGTPSQSFKVLFDSGSSSMWIRDSNCGSQSCSNPGFVSAKSKTFQTVNSNSHSINYMDGSFIQGPLVEDAVNVGGKSVQQEFYLAKTDGSAVGFAVDGILGLAFPNTLPTFFGNLISSNQITKQVFSVYYSKDLQSGSMLLGGIDTNRYGGELLWNLVYGDSSSGSAPFSLWKTKLDYLSMNDKNVTLSDSFDLIFDTGTALSNFPVAIADKINTALGFSFIPGQNVTYGFPCPNSTIPTALPNITFGLGSGAINFHPEEYVYFSSLVSNKTTHVYCTSAFVGRPNLTDSAIFGNILTQKLYVVHDYKNMKIGVAAANRNTTLTGTFVAADSTDAPAGSWNGSADRYTMRTNNSKPFSNSGVISAVSLNLLITMLLTLNR